MFTLSIAVIMLFSLVSFPNEMNGILTSGSGATITNVATKTNDAPVDTPNLIKQGNDLVAANRQKQVDNYLSPDEVRSKLDSIYGVQGTDLYTDTNAKYDPTVKQLNQVIVSFNTMAEKDAFVQALSPELLVKDFTLLPSVVVTQSQGIYDLLMSATTTTDIIGDTLLSLPDFTVDDKEEPDTSFFNSEGRIGAWAMHDLGFTGKNVKIAVVDTGIDATHQDLQVTGDGSPKVIAAQSFVPGEDAQDYIGHGTHVAGTAAGNGYQIGVAPDAQLLNAKVCSNAGCATSWMLEAIEWAIQQDVDIITMSIGGSTIFGIDPLDYIIDYAWSHGIVLTIAAGNAGPSPSTVSTPGTGPRVITVGATDVYDLVTAFSGRGPSVYGTFDPDLSAPGMGIFSTLPGNHYGIYSGTSMATPHVAGAVALMKEAHPRSSNDEIKANMMANAKNMDDFGANTQGAGLVDLETTQTNWDTRQSLIFPVLSAKDTFYLTPGETYTGYLDYISSRRGAVPDLDLDHSRAFRVHIDDDINPRISGHQFIKFSITVPDDATVGDVLERSLTITYTSHKSDHHSRHIEGDHGDHGDHGSSRFFDRDTMSITVQVVERENDAFKGFDASDTFVGATRVWFSNFTGYASDIDFYKVQLQAGQVYTIKLDGMSPNSDFDLGVYDRNGVLTCDSCNIYLGGNTPESVVLTATYDGYYYLRVDPWSVLYVDPYLNSDTSGPYQIIMKHGADTGGGNSGTTGTQFNFLGATVDAVDEDSDGVFDYLSIDVSVDVTSVGFLDAYAFLTLDKGGPVQNWFFAVAFTEFYEFTTTGVQSFTLTLDAVYFADQSFVGSVVLYELFMGDPSSFTILYDLFDVTSSATLDSADFGLQSMIYNYLSAIPYDENGDGTADWLQVAVSVDVISTYSYYTTFYATLFHPDGFYIYSDNGADIDLSVAGEQVMYFYFDPATFLTGSSDPVDLQLIITYAWDHPLMIQTLHYGSFPYILTIGDTITVDPADYAGAGSASITSISDFGIDTDGDGNYNYLVIETTVDVGTPGFFSLSFHPWLWSISDQRVLFDFESDAYSNIQWLESGSHTMYMTISGELINALQVNGPLMILDIWLDAWDEQSWGYDFSGTIEDYQNYLTADYNWTDFDASGAIFQGISGLNYVDLNGDGEAETMELILSIQVNYPGDFYFFLTMFDYPLGGSRFGAAADTFWYFNSVGTYNVSFYIDGRDLWLAGYTGAMEVWELDIFNANTGDITYFNFENGLFDVDYTQLPGSAPPGSIAAVSDFPVDTNANGLYEYIEVDVTIDVRREAYFYMYMDVFGGDNFFEYVGFYYSDLYAPGPGTYTITFLIPATDLLRNVAESSTALELWLYLFDDSGFNGDAGPIYTDVYDLSMFERPAAFSSLTDTAVDENGNGLYEYLQISVTVDVNTPGEYFIDMESYIGATGNYLGYSSGYLDATTSGTYTVDLYISGTNIIAQSPVDYTNFELWLFLSNFDGLVDEIMGYYTDYYYVSDFEYSALITGVTDSAVDNNGNGLFEGIQVQLTVDVNVAGDYFFNMDVYSGVTYNWVGYAYTSLYAATSGSYTVDLVIDSGSLLANTGVDSSDFEMYIYMYDSNGMLQMVDYFTDFYDLTLFETTASITGAYDMALDNDGNGLYEFIAVYVDLSIGISDYYMIGLQMYGNDDLGYGEYVVGYYDQLYLDPGTYTVEILLPTSLILSRLTDDYTDFLTYITLENFSTQLDSFIYYTQYYTMADLEMIVDVLNVTDYGDDTNANGLFDYLVINVQMDISKAGDYSVLTDLYGDADTSFTYIGYYETSFTVTTPGIYDITMVVPATDIIAAGLQAVTNFYYYAVVVDATPYVVTLAGPFYSGYYSLSDFDTA